MTEIKETACAKLNLSLDITGKRGDGYHEIVTVMQTVSVCDELTLKLAESGRVRASSNLRFIPGDERNLAVRAAMAYMAAAGIENQGIDIRINKKTPVGAGMGGGSADAAAVLRGMNRLFDGRLDEDTLSSLAASIGSDVAFLLHGGTVLATGRGEKLKRLTPVPECRFVICKPDFSISTPELYKKLDESPVRCHPDTAGILRAIDNGELSELCRRMYNVFEYVDDRRMRTVAEIKSLLLDAGALGAIMTGTGSAVFGVFRPDAPTAEICAGFKGKVGFCCAAEPVKMF